MSQQIFEDLKIPKSYKNLGIGSGTHAVQTANIMISFEKLLIKEKPGLVIVVGDVNSTVACSLVSVKMGIPVAHIEAGLRSFDREMPEEINRLVTDSISDLLFTSCEGAKEQLMSEGIPSSKIFFTGNVMVDTLYANLEKCIRPKIINERGVKDKYAVLTIHRPSNVDDSRYLLSILEGIGEIQRRVPVIFPAHPRTRKMLDKKEIKAKAKQMGALHIVPPLGYLDFIGLMKHADLVLTDSGGIQEETTIMRVPCLTLRENTERPITISKGTNRLVGSDSKEIIKHGVKLLKKGTKGSKRPKLWDGKAAQRIVSVLARKFDLK